MSVQRKTRVIVGLSGGVDSSVSALLLQRAGYDVQGMFMKNWDEDDDVDYCPAAQDIADAKAVCLELGIPLHKVNFAKEYWDRVFRHFLHEYQAGRTPNPDVLCNREIKFDVFLRRALTLGAERMATGHYARVIHDGGRHRLLKARDLTKDQSYFLYALNQRQLGATLFPLGDIIKPEVRRLAAEAGLVTSGKKDSTGICFIGERDFSDFLNRYLPAQPGEIRTPEGRLIGTHQGLMFHTLGQRKGLGIGGDAAGSGEPWFVVGKRLGDNVLVAAQGHDHPLLYSEALEAIDLNWISGPPPQTPYACTAKTRYRQTDQDCVIERIEDGRCLVRFSTPQRAVTPGQSVVFYAGEECLGGGIIDRVDGIIYA